MNQGVKTSKIERWLLIYSQPPKAIYFLSSGRSPTKLLEFLDAGVKKFFAKYSRAAKIQK